MDRLTRRDILKEIDKIKISDLNDICKSQNCSLQPNFKSRLRNNEVISKRENKAILFCRETKEYALLVNLNTKLEYEDMVCFLKIIEDTLYLLDASLAMFIHYMDKDKSYFCNMKQRTVLWKEAHLVLSFLDSYMRSRGTIVGYKLPSKLKELNDELKTLSYGQGETYGR